MLCQSRSKASLEKVAAQLSALAQDVEPSMKWPNFWGQFLMYFEFRWFWYVFEVWESSFLVSTAGYPHLCLCDRFLEFSLSILLLSSLLSWLVLIVNCYHDCYYILLFFKDTYSIFKIWRKRYLCTAYSLYGCTRRSPWPRLLSGHRSAQKLLANSHGASWKK